MSRCKVINARCNFIIAYICQTIYIYMLPFNIIVFAINSGNKAIVFSSNRKFNIFNLIASINRIS